MSIELRVAGLAPQDAGRGIARLSASSMEKLEVEPGDVVQLTGRRRTVAKVLPAYKGDQEDIIRIDGNVRMNADAGIDEFLEVERTDSQPAESVTIALPERVILRGVEPFLGRHLLDHHSSEAIRYTSGSWVNRSSSSSLGRRRPGPS